MGFTYPEQFADIISISISLAHIEAQWLIRWVGADDQAQQERHIEIHQHNLNHRDNSHKIKVGLIRSYM